MAKKKRRPLSGCTCFIIRGYHCACTAQRHTYPCWDERHRPTQRL